MTKLYLTLASLAAAASSVVALVTYIDPSPVPVDMFEGLHLSAPEPALDIIDDEILNAPVVSYQSDTFSYKVSYPSNWTLDDSRGDFDGDILTDPDQHVVITINEIKDSSILSEEGTREIAKSIRDSVRFDAGFSLSEFQSFRWDGRYALFTDGMRLISGEPYRTREYNIFRPEHGGILNISITTLSHAEALYENTIMNILESLDVCPDA